ncbi:MAG: hypothetical protein EBR82_58250 [Caulobacteraceae bacterium]|nr:hypothetical protein [Caulobacteraceae bacterium]
MSGPPATGAARGRRRRGRRAVPDRGNLDGDTIMPLTIDDRPTIGAPVPGAEYFTIQPVVRLESFPPEWLSLEVYPGDVAAGNYLAAVDDSGAVGPPLAFPAWSAAPEYWLPINRHGWRPAVRVVVTGRRPVRWGGEYWMRARVEFCHDGGPSEYVSGWILCR